MWRRTRKERERLERLHGWGATVEADIGIASAGALRLLQKRVQGHVMLPTDTAYDHARQLTNQAFQSFNMGYASAMAWVLLLIIAFFTVLAFKSSSFWVYYDTQGD